MSRAAAVPTVPSMPATLFVAALSVVPALLVGGLALAATQHPALYGVLAWFGPLAVIGGGFASLAAVLWPLARRDAAEERLRRVGERVEGTIAEIGGTGVRINKAPLLRLTLVVEDAGEPRTVVTDVLVPAHEAWRYRPGAVLPLRVDPDNLDHVVVDVVPAG
jgi:hypothetical protein